MNESGHSLSDPTENVKHMLGEAVIRLDGLRAAEIQRVDELRTSGQETLKVELEAEFKRVNEQMGAERQRVNEQMGAERQRVNEQMVLRAEYNAQLAVAEAKRIDAIRAVDVAAVAVANERATAQAAVLANQVAASADALRALVAATAATVATQLQQITAQFTDRLSSLEKSQYVSSGSGSGMRDMYAWVFAGIMALVTIGSVLFSIFRK